MTTLPATSIDLSRLPAPSVLEALDFEGLFAGFATRFKAFWAEAQALDPSLPDYDVDMLETDPVVIAGEAWSYLRLLDRARVNDAAKAVLAPFAKGPDLDSVVARLGVLRLNLKPADPITGAPKVDESDESLLERYLLAFDRPSAGSPGRYKYEALTALVALGEEGWLVEVNGRAVHGRRGDTDIVIAGPAGRVPTSDEIAAARDACTADGVKPEAVSVNVLPATRVTYAVSLVIEIPRGPDASLIVAEAAARVKAVTDGRTKIAAEVPAELIGGAAYGPNVIRVRRDSPSDDLAAEPYSIPVCTGIVVAPEVRA